MINNNIENCVTSVTHLTLLQRMRNTRQEVPIAKESCAVPVLIEVHPVKHHLPPLIREWISICLDEGHIQPSQPHVGKLEGWPIRPYFKSSLYTDFECWCLKANISTYLILLRNYSIKGPMSFLNKYQMININFPL